jgi:hypothetical protein
VKKILNALNVVSDDAGKIINFIKSRPLNSWIHCKLCYEMDSSHTWRFNGCYYAEFWFMYSHCNKKWCYSVLTIPSSFHHICVILLVSRGFSFCFILSCPFVLPEF